MVASFNRTFAFSSICHCIIHCRSKSLLIPTSGGGNFWIPSKRMPTKHCFWAIRYSSFQSTSFKEPGISLAEPMQNRKKSKKIFCCFNIKLYFCTHETNHTHHIILHSSYHPPSDLVVCIFLMIHIIRGEEAGTRNRFLDWGLQQLTEQVENLTDTHHPFRLLIHVIELLILLKLNQMVKIRSHKNTLLQVLQEFLTSDILNIYYLILLLFPFLF